MNLSNIYQCYCLIPKRNKLTHIHRQSVYCSENNNTRHGLLEMHFNCSIYSESEQSHQQVLRVTVEEPIAFAGEQSVNKIITQM